MTIIAETSAVTLAVVKVEYGALWGILTGVLDALPFIGTGIVLIPLQSPNFFWILYGIENGSGTIRQQTLGENLKKKRVKWLINLKE